MQSENSHTICGAKKRDGQPCQSRPMPNGRCRMHGGKIPSGSALPQFKTGRYSKYLPARLLQRYHQAEADPDLLALHSELALLDTRLAELLGRIHTGESGRFYLDTRTGCRQILQAVKEGDAAKMKEGLTALQSLAEQGLSDEAVWGEIAALVEARRKLVESEQKRLVAMQQMITATEAMTLLAAVTEIVYRYVPDPTARKALSADIGRLVAHRSSETD